MKPEDNVPKDEEASNPAPVAGDVIGDTAYSERFVLKIMLKLANLDTLKDEVVEKSFEDDLCTLWDMTAERDVVLFLQKHNIMNVFNFALPVIESPRIIEIIVGIIANMCCQKEIVAVLMKMESFLTFLLDYMTTDDSLILIQVLRLINHSLFVADDDHISIWMDLFTNIGYSTTFYFILKNSSNKKLIITALENYNTICSYCNIEKCRTNFFTHFVSPDALESLSIAFTEVTVNQKYSCDSEELERILVISLQICLNLVGFDKSLEVFSSSKDHVTSMISQVLSYYENKLINQKEIDSDLVDIIDSTTTIVKILQISESCDPDKYFVQSYSLWKALRSVCKSDKNGCDFEDGDKDELQDLSKKMSFPLSTLIGIYMANCSEDHFFIVLDKIGSDYEIIKSLIKDKEILMQVTKRAANRTRLKENVDS